MATTAVTELRIKGSDGTFTEAYPIGVKAENVVTSTGANIETFVQNFSSVSFKVEDKVLYISSTAT